MMLGQNEVQEATIVSSGYSGQFGGAAGTNVNYLTKSGGNKFHGNAQYDWNGSALNANDWLDNAQGNPRPFDVARQCAGSLGGPIKRDKLFFFFDTRGIHVILPYISQVVRPRAKFESVTMANIDSVFGILDPSFSRSLSAGMKAILVVMWTNVCGLSGTEYGTGALLSTTGFQPEFRLAG